MAYVTIPRSTGRVRSGGRTHVARSCGGQQAKRPTVGWYDEFNYDAPTHLLVYECDTDPEFTGVLDERGEPIYRIYERRPIGFHDGWQQE